MASHKYFIDRMERTLSNSKLIVKFSVLLRNRLVRIIAYSLVKDHTVEKSGELLLTKEIGHLLKSVIDAGANKSEWSEMILSHSSSRLTFLLLIEPGKNAFDILKNKFGRDLRFTMLNMGVSDTDGMLSFNEEEDASETSSFAATTNPGMQQNCIPVKRLDTILKDTNFGQVDFLKIDCEGFDFKVITGALENIREGKVGIIQFEYNTMWINAGSTLKAAFDLLISCGYKVYLLNNDGLSSFNIDFYKEFFGYSNFVAVSPAWMPAVRELIHAETY